MNSHRMINCLLASAFIWAVNSFAYTQEVTKIDIDGLSEARAPKSEVEMRSWLENMVWHHRYSIDEIRLATGMSVDRITRALNEFDISERSKPKPTSDKLVVLPFPGGRHPRIGFLEGAIDPQRDTKASVFLPWDAASYVVLDVPEAVFIDQSLIYLAHTHVPTVWDKKGVNLQQLEWKVQNDGSLQNERTLPNGITFGAKIMSTANAVQMEMWLTNGTRQVLTDLHMQYCVYLKNAKGFNQQTNANKFFSKSYASCHSGSADRWIITAWDQVEEAYGNAECPCLHSDPRFPDCPPGETQRVRGWLSFYEGKDIEEELERLDSLGWRRSNVSKTPATPVDNCRTKSTSLEGEHAR